jgi:hypothetical protein
MNYLKEICSFKFDELLYNSCGTQVKKHLDVKNKKMLANLNERLAIHWAPLNGITLGQTITDPINRMIPIS